MILRRVIKHFRNQEWTAIFLDFLIVVVGVFVGLQVQNWNEAQGEASKEVAYLASLKSDFSQVIAQLEGDSARYLEIADEMTFLLEQSRMKTPDASIEKLNAAAANLITMVGTPIVADTYTNLTGSGDLSIIKSQAIKNKLASFYAQTDVVGLVAGTHEMQLVKIFQPYIMENLDYVGMLPTSREVPPPSAFPAKEILTALPTREFRNVVAIKWDITTDTNNIIQLALKEAYEVKTLLDKEMETNP
ncbi:MAG: hypothetical protein COA47_16160 [Robiginitomaculum sp.]|nr:MAG: hypothetical protein COA47_16160 [Robiginitomaculum sp.]